MWQWREEELEGLRISAVRALERTILVEVKVGSDALTPSARRLAFSIVNERDEPVYLYRLAGTPEEPFRVLIPPRGGVLTMSLFEDGPIVLEGWRVVSDERHTLVKVLELERIATGRAEREAT